MVTLSVELGLAPDEARSLVLDELELAGVEAELRFEPAGRGTRVILELDRPLELLGEWFVSQALVPLLQATSAHAYGDWLTDRRARRPSGAQARRVYADPTYHYPNFHAILHELELTSDDRLLEVGCGGGVFLRLALRSGCRAAAVDHSPDMVRLAREQNAEAIEDGRLRILEADAAALPFPDGEFTAAVMTGVLAMLPDPVAALAEIHRVLRPGGKLVVLGSDPAWRGTPAAPEPIASRLRFYEDSELEALGRDAGFEDVQVERIPLAGYAREAGLPEEHLALFEGPGAPFLIARRH